MDLGAQHERELVDACAHGEEAAWHELVRRYDRGVLHVLWQTGAREDLDDLRQEVWARLLARDAAVLRTFRGEHGGALRVFLARVARSVAVDHGRSLRARPRTSSEPADVAQDAPDPDVALSLAQDRERVVRALDVAAQEGENPARDRDILRLHFEQGFSALEISQAGLGLSVRGVESVLRRAKQRLVELLREEEP